MSKQQALDTAKTAHFAVDGDGLTEVVRNMVMSERASQAYRLLADNLIGQSKAVAAATALQILKGEKRLAGLSDGPKGLRLANEKKDVAEGYLETLRFIFAGRIRVGDTWWRPHAVVRAFGPLDAAHASEVTGRGIPTIFDPHAEAYHRARVEFYAPDGYRVLKIEPSAESRARGDKWEFVIFEPVGEPPFWWAEHRDAGAALKDFIAAGRHLEEIEGLAEDDIERRNRRLARMQAEEAAAEEELCVEEEEAEREKYLAQLVEIREAVNAQANGDYTEITLEEDWEKFDGTAVPAGTKIRVARAPFTQWSLRRTSLYHLAPPWKCVSQMGMKMPGDDQYHTDWMIGAGLDLSESYSHALKNAAYTRMGEIQEEVGGFEATVLVTAPDCDGRVGKTSGTIAVLKDLSDTPHNNEAIANARAVITENGGELSHGAILARENGIPVMLVHDAVTRYPLGTHLTLEPSVGKITQHWEHRSIWALPTIPAAEAE